MNTQELITRSDEAIKYNHVLVLHDRISGNRKKNVDFHVVVGDYFGTLATVLDILRQDKNISEQMREKTLENLRNDLEYLQDNYFIMRK